MSAPNFKATTDQGLAAVSDLISHKSDYKNFQADVGDDVLVLASLARQMTLVNAAVPGPVLAIDPAHHETFKSAVPVLEAIGAEPVGSVLSVTIGVFIQQLLKWLATLGVKS